MLFCRPKRHKPNSVTVDDVEYSVVNIMSDGRCFYRCAAAYGCHDIKSATRNAVGCPHDTKLYHRETEIADALRLRTVSFLLTHSEKLNELVLQLPFLLDNGVICNYTSVSERLTKMANTSEFAGLLEISALAFLAELEIQVVYKKGTDLSVHSKFWFGSPLANSASVLRLLYDMDESKKPGHFSLLVHSTEHVSCLDNSRIILLANSSPNDMTGDFTGKLMSLLTSQPSTDSKTSCEAVLADLHARSPASPAQAPINTECLGSKSRSMKSELDTNQPVQINDKLYPTVCKDYEQFNTWRNSRPWLAVHPDDNNRVVCTTCQTVKTSVLALSMTVNKRSRKEHAFIEQGISAATAKNY